MDPIKGDTIPFGSMNFSISRKLGLHFERSDTVHCRLFLTDQPHPLRCAQQALPTDPSSRLLVSIEHGDSHAWLFTRGKKAVLRANYFIDELEGLDIKVSRTMKRRIWTERLHG